MNVFIMIQYDFWINIQGLCAMFQDEISIMFTMHMAMAIIMMSQVNIVASP